MFALCMERQPAGSYLHPPQDTAPGSCGDTALDTMAQPEGLEKVSIGFCRNADVQPRTTGSKQSILLLGGKEVFQQSHSVPIENTEFVDAALPPKVQLEVGEQSPAGSVQMQQLLRDRYGWSCTIQSHMCAFVLCSLSFPDQAKKTVNITEENPACLVVWSCCWEGNGSPLITTLPWGPQMPQPCWM